MANKQDVTLVLHSQGSSGRKLNSVDWPQWMWPVDDRFLSYWWVLPTVFAVF
jgi:hypothetical protein